MNEILHLINEMSPYLLLGFFMAGLMHAFIPKKFYTKYLSGRSFRSVLNAAILGIPLPLCSCGVIPTAMSLRKEGASKGAATSFLIATPQTGVDSIIATFSLMGLPFAIIRPIVAFITALFGGALVNTVDKDEEATNPAAYGTAAPGSAGAPPAITGYAGVSPAITGYGGVSPAITGYAGVSPANNHETSSSCCCHNHEAEKQAEEHSCCHHHHHHEEAAAASCCCHHEEATPDMPFGAKMRIALRYAFVDMMEDIGKWLVIGIIIAALITAVVPDTFFAIFKDNTLLSMLLVLAISIPMYVCATGSIPIAVALMLKGLTPGAALVLLMAGPAANMASILVIRQRLGTRTLVAYLASIVGGAIGFGILIDYLLPRTWFTSSLTALQTCCENTGNWFQWTCTALLCLLLLNALWPRRK
ncbi:MAG: SO_0444 family Cu/Zn efflux transporter [Alloprevotella sp.]|nr:SO_0444 family Cu/Zn efflux transporter [Alloprevotella sp.]